MKKLYGNIIALLFLSMIGLCSCALHHASSLLKKMNCTEITHIGITYSDSTKHYQQFELGKLKGYYNIRIEKKDSGLIKLNNDYCTTFSLFKKARFYRKQQKSSDNQKRNQEIINFKIWIERLDDWAVIYPLTGEVYYSNHKSYLKIGRDIPLFYYAKRSYYIPNKLSKELIDFANVLIMYRNNQVKNDTLLVDSLRKAYPLRRICNASE